MFKDYYGYDMPKIMTDDVKQFRWREALFILEDTSRKIKEINPNFEITCCVHATLNTYYVTEHRGYDNWDMVAASPYFDVFSTTIIAWSLPADFAQIEKVVDLYDSLGVDRIAAWTYRGGYGTVLAAPDALKLWDRIGENYKRILKK